MCQIISKQQYELCEMFQSIQDIEFKFCFQERRNLVENVTGI